MCRTARITAGEYNHSAAHNTGADTTTQLAVPDTVLYTQSNPYLVCTAKASLAVGSGALLWICSVLIVGILAYILIIKAVNHPGREAWAHSVAALTGSKRNVKPQATSTCTTSNRGSATTVEDPFAEPEALRPFLSMDLVADENHDSSADNNPSRTARYSSSSSNPYGSSSHSQSQAHHSRSYYSLQDHSESQLSLPRASTSHNSPRRNRERGSTISDNRTSQDLYDHPLALTPSHSRTHSDLSYDSRGYNYADMPPPVPPLPQVISEEKRRVREPQTIVDEKRRERQPQAVLDEKRRDRASIFRPPYSEPASAKGKGRIPLRILPPEPGIRREESAIVSAVSDVFSVMAEFAGSPRSPRTMTDPFPPMALPLPGTPELSTFSPSRDVTPRPVAHSSGGQGIDVWQEQVRRDEAPPYTPPLTGGQWCGNGAEHRPMSSLGSSSGLHPWSDDVHAQAWYSLYAPGSATSLVRTNLQGTQSFNSSGSGYPFSFASSSHDGSHSHESGSSLTPHTYADALGYRRSTVPRHANTCSSGLGGLPFPRPGTMQQQEEEATLFFSDPRPPLPQAGKPQLVIRNVSQPRSPLPRTPGPPVTPGAADEATLFFSDPRSQPPPHPPRAPRGTRLDEATGTDEATLFFNRAPVPEPVNAAPLSASASAPSSSGGEMRGRMLSDEASRFFNRAPRQAGAKPPTPSYLLLPQSPPKSLVTEDATLFFNRPPLPTPPISATLDVEEDEATLFSPAKSRGEQGQLDGEVEWEGGGGVFVGGHFWSLDMRRDEQGL